MKLFGFLTATASCFDIGTLMMMQQGGLNGLLGGGLPAAAPAAGNDMMGGLMSNPLMLYQMMSGNSIFGGDKLEKFLPLLMGGNGGQLANILPLLALTDKKEDEAPASSSPVVFKAETAYQAVCNDIDDITKKFDCVKQIYDIFECQPAAKSLDIADLGTAFETFKGEVNKFTATGACVNRCDAIIIPDEKAKCVTKAEAAHNAIFPPSASSSSTGSSLFDDPIMMMMMMSGQNMFNMMSGGIGAANGLTGMNPMLLNALLKN